MDRVGGDLVLADPTGFPSVALVRHPDLIRSLLIERVGAFVKSRAFRQVALLVGDGLLTSEPPRHTRQRRLILPAFHHSRLRAYAETMVRLSVDAADGWTPGRAFEAGAAMNRLALEIAAETLFGTSVATDRVGHALEELMEAFDRTQFPGADRLAWLPIRANRLLKRSRATIDDVVYGFIAERRAAPVAAGASRVSADRGDLLDLLLAAQDEETGTGMTDEEVRDEAVTILLAGHETTANALTWTWALLAEHPDVEARLHAEVDALGHAPTFEDLGALPYTRGVFAEALRLRPPAWAVGREAAQDTDLGGVPIAKGVTILFAPLHLHRDPRFWSEPERFDPDRHRPEAKSSRHKFSYLPFSAGRRGCIGEQFAWVEGTLVLATLAQRWRLRLAGPVPETHGSVTLRPAGPVRLIPEAR